MDAAKQPAPLRRGPQEASRPLGIRGQELASFDVTSDPPVVADLPDEVSSSSSQIA